jgi:glycosyltransferase involved in cell wall biosynthesis
MIIIHDKLLEYGGAEHVLLELIRGLKPKFIFVPCVDDIEKWETYYSCEIKTLKIFSWVDNQKKYRIFYPVLAIYLMIFAITEEADTLKLYYSSSLGKFVRFKSSGPKLLFSNFPFKGVLKTKDYLKDASSLKRLAILFLIPAMKWLEKCALKKFDRISVISSDAKLAYEKNFKMHIETIIHCPVDVVKLCAISNKKRSEFKHALVICRLYEEKGVGELLDIMNGLEGIHTTVIGDGPKIHKFVKQYPKVSFKGFVTDDEKLLLLQDSDFLINPTAQEWSLTTVEANCAGIPVVSAECNAIEEINECITGVPSRPNITYLMEKGSFEDALKKLKTMSVQERSTALAYFSPQKFITRIKDFING